MSKLKQPQADTPGQIESWLADLVAQSLEMSASQLDTNAHLSRYGLDSVSTVSIMTAISDMTGLVISENALLEYPTISLLAGYIRTQASETGDTVRPPEGRADLHSLMLRDSILPVDIKPPTGESRRQPDSDPADWRHRVSRHPPSGCPAEKYRGTHLLSGSRVKGQ